MLHFMHDKNTIDHYVFLSSDVLSSDVLTVASLKSIHRKVHLEVDV